MGSLPGFQVHVAAGAPSAPRTCWKGVSSHPCSRRSPSSRAWPARDAVVAEPAHSAVGMGTVEKGVVFRPLKTLSSRATASVAP